MINPEKNPRVYDVAVIAGVPTPGLCEIVGAAKKLTWEKKKGRGSSGATTVYTGDDLVEFTMRLELYHGVRGQNLDEQLAVIRDQILPALAAASKGKSAVDFYHPKTAEPPVDVRAVVPTEIGALEQQDDLWTWTVKFLQFRKPAPAIGRPAAAAASKKAGASGAKTGRDQAIEALGQQKDQRGKELAGI